MVGEGLFLRAAAAPTAGLRDLQGVVISKLIKLGMEHFFLKFLLRITLKVHELDNKVYEDR